MIEETLKQVAEKKGCSKDLCIFLDKLEYNLQLMLLGKFCVMRVIEDGADEYTIVKVALANIGRCLSEFIPGERSRDEYTDDEWAKEGEEEFIKHCTDSGRFRYEDFTYKHREPYKPIDDEFWGQRGILNNKDS